MLFPNLVNHGRLTDVALQSLKPGAWLWKSPSQQALDLSHYGGKQIVLTLFLHKFEALSVASPIKVKLADC